MIKKSALLLISLIYAINLAQQIKINLDVFPLCIPADSSSTALITISAKDAMGKPPPDGIIVKLSTSLGEVTPAEVTLKNGSGTAVLRSTSKNGTALITAKWEEVTATAYAYFANPPQNMALMKSTQFAPADGITPVFIYAFVYDDNPQGAVVDGTPVKFNSTLGEITKNTLTFGGQAVAKIISSVPGDALITAECGSAKASTVVTFLAGTPTHLELAATSLFVRADGKSKVTIKARVYGKNNAPIADGIQVNFQTTAGTITPSALTEKGVATAYLIAPPTPQKATITASCGDIEGKLVITFTGPPSQIKLFWRPFPQFLPQGDVSLQLFAQLTDANDNPIGPDCLVSFSTTRGEITATAPTDAGGVAQAVLKVPPEDGEVIVTARVDSVEDSKKLILTTKPKSLRLLAMPSSIPADGKSKALLQCYLITPQEEIFIGGERVTFTTNKGTIFPKMEGMLREGVAEAFLLSESQPGIAEVSAIAGEYTTSINVIFSSQPASISLTSYPVKPVRGETIYLKAVVKDAQGNIIADGSPVFFNVKGIGVNYSFETVTNNGQAVINIKDINKGNYEVEAASGGVRTKIAFTCE